MKKKVLVVYGGASKERKISLKSGLACIKALKKLGYKIKVFDPKKENLDKLSKYKNYLIFNALHGQYGEDGYVQSILETTNIPYTHSGVISSAIAMDKELSKKIFIENNI